MLIASVSFFFFFSPSLSCFNHGAEFRESKHSTCSAEGSSETPRCLRVADADYRFTLWPRKPLIAKADAARHLTIRRGERDDWLAYISAMEHRLYCICVCLWLCACTVLSVSSLSCGKRLQRLFGGFLRWNAQLILSGVITLQVYGSQVAVFKRYIKSCSHNVRDALLTLSPWPSMSTVDSRPFTFFFFFGLKWNKTGATWNSKFPAQWTLFQSEGLLAACRQPIHSRRSVPRICDDTSWHSSSRFQPAGWEDGATHLKMHSRADMFSRQNWHTTRNVSHIQGIYFTVPHETASTLRQPLFHELMVASCLIMSQLLHWRCALERPRLLRAYVIYINGTTKRLLFPARGVEEGLSCWSV